MRLHAHVRALEYPRPIVIAGYRFEGQRVLRVELEHRGRRAQAEAAGVFYRGDTAEALLAQAQALPIDDGCGFDDVERLVRGLPAGGVRNALDWALWQLRADALGVPAWRLAHLDGVRALPTTFTLGVDTPEAMAAEARGLEGARALKLKLDGGDDDPARVRAVRAARPDVRLMVDANQGWTLAQLRSWSPALAACGVEAIEQPLPADADAALEGVDWPVPLAADESFQTLDDLDRVAARYAIANIKLDKCGGLGEALVQAHAVRRAGLKVMVGCMGGSSMAMRPAFIAGQFADLVDLDAPLIIAGDVSPPARYAEGRIDFAADGLAPVSAAAALS